MENLRLRARPSVLAERKLAEAKGQSRNQKIALGVCGAVLLVVLAVELPGLLAKGAGSGADVLTPVPSAAAAVTPPVATALTPDGALARIARLPARDPFLPQVGLPGGGTAAPAPGSAASTTTPRGPAVRRSGFVSKDPFVPQLQTPAGAAAVAGSAGPSSVAVTPLPLNLAVPGSGYIVVLASEPAAEGEQAAARAVVAAENAGLPDVKSSLLRTRTGSSLDVYMGPYATSALAQQQLIRALRVGYTLASVEALPGSQPSL